MAGPLDLVAAARIHHPAPELLVVTGGEAFPLDGRPLPPHVRAMPDAERARVRGDAGGALAIFAHDVRISGGSWWFRDAALRHTEDPLP